MTNKEKTQLQKEIVDSLPEDLRGRLIVAPRVGKTKLVIDIIKEKKPKTILWVTPGKDLAEEAIPEEFIKWKAKKFLKGLTTVTWKSLHNIKGYFDIIILDEEQYGTDNNLKNLESEELNAKFIVTLTGTQTRNYDKNALYNRLNLPVIADFGINEAVDSGILADYRITVLEVPMSIALDIQVGNKDKRWKTSELKQYLYVDDIAKKAIKKKSDALFPILNRMRTIYNSPSKRKMAAKLRDTLKGRKLFFSSSIANAEELHSNTYHSKTNNKYLKAFQNHETDILSLVNSGGTGTTYTEIDHLIIVQADKDDNGSTSQKITRTLLGQGENYKGNIWVICLKKTEDVNWVASTLSRFDIDKVVYLSLDSENTIIEYDSMLPIDFEKDYPMFKLSPNAMNLFNQEEVQDGN